MEECQRDWDADGAALLRKRIHADALALSHRWNEEMSRKEEQGDRKGELESNHMEACSDSDDDVIIVDTVTMG